MYLILLADFREEFGKSTNQQDFDTHIYSNKSLAMYTSEIQQINKETITCSSFFLYLCKGIWKINKSTENLTIYNCRLNISRLI